MAIRILVVDDASFIRDMVKKHLRERLPGVEIAEAVDGQRALALIKKQSFDLVLSDWEMPGMGGDELLRAVRELEGAEDLPFVMVTSRGDRNHVIKAVEAGVSDYLTKPFTPDELLRKVFKQLKAAGIDVAPSGRQGATQGIASASVAALTGNRTAVESTAAPTAARGKGRAQLRFSARKGSVGCVVRELSLQALSGLIQRSQDIPTVFEQVVVDLDLGEGSEPARINGYVHSVQAGEPKPGSQVLKLVIRFVDKDASKYEALSQYIAQM
ncbi:response regulator [Marinimicrobium alkaliphilum]|uniref:response regulator n=1 Tax=Marinimicrobium alkaliphilum TaxID=2202654 RepID=UPI000DBAA4CF|nr:response regulator [Marinimicrobium alkaliphilum]